MGGRYRSLILAAALILMGCTATPVDPERTTEPVAHDHDEFNHTHNMTRDLISNLTERLNTTLNLPLTECGRGWDNDSDRLNVFEELDRGTDPCDPDTDGDGLSDWAEVYRNWTDPLDNDTDDDNLTDGLDPHPLQDDHGEDGDGVWDQHDIDMYKDVFVDIYINWSHTGDQDQMPLVIPDLGIDENTNVGDNWSNEWWINNNTDWPDNKHSVQVTANGVYYLLPLYGSIIYEADGWYCEVSIH